MATPDRVQSRAWWPTTGTPGREEYVGPAVCGECHSARAALQKSTAMARAATAPTDSDVLRVYGRLSFHSGKYTYTLEPKEGAVVYSVSDGGHSVSVPLSWEFGLGKVGQAYFF